MDRVRNHPFWYFVYLLFSALPILLAINHMFRLRLFGVTLLDYTYLYYMLTFYLSIVFLDLSGQENRAPRIEFPGTICFFHAYLHRQWLSGSPGIKYCRLRLGIFRSTCTDLF